MRKITIVSMALAASDDWFNNLDKRAQDSYIKSHPHSKYAKNANKKKAEDAEILNTSQKNKIDKANVEKLPAGKKPVNNGKVTLTGPGADKNEGKDPFIKGLEDKLEVT